MKARRIDGGGLPNVRSHCRKLPTPRVTIAIPVFNGSNYLAEAIDSALSQTYANVEVLVVDDGSTDNGATARIARSFEPHIRYIYQPNGGVSTALNTAIRSMSGDAFAWLSHDDVHEPEKTAVQVDFFRRLNSPTACFFSDFRWINSQGTVTDEQRYDAALLRRWPALGFFECMINGCTTFIPKHVLNVVGNFSVEHRYTQDYRMWWAIERRFGFLHLPMPLAQIRRHPDQGSSKPAFLAEGEAFWETVLNEATTVDHAPAGSAKRFYSRMGRFLQERSPNRRAARRAFAKASEAGEALQASAVLLAGGGSSGDPQRASGTALARSVSSALQQGTHLAELIVVFPAHGAPGQEAALELAAADPRLRITHEGDVPGFQSWMAGLIRAHAEYMALLLEGDIWLPRKLAIQLDDASKSGRLVSHTSYRIAASNYGPPQNVQSGNFAGHVYPEIIGQPILAPSTIVVHRSLVASGWCFVAGDEHLNVVDIASRHCIAGVPTVLAELPAAPLVASSRIADRLAADPQHSRHSGALARLRATGQRSPASYARIPMDGRHSQAAPTRRTLGEETRGRDGIVR